MATDAAAFEEMAAATFPALAALLGAQLDEDEARIYGIVVSLSPDQLAAVTIALSAMMPADAPLPGPTSLADTLSRVHAAGTAAMNAPITAEQAARNRADLAHALGWLPPADDETAVCSRCEKRLPHEEFYADNSTPTGRAYRCKTCDGEYRAINRRAPTMKRTAA